jgi:hypothetical protein
MRNGKKLLFVLVRVKWRILRPGFGAWADSHLPAVGGRPPIPDSQWV